MLGLGHRQHGMNLIELMIGLAIFAILVTMAVPTFATWMRNTQIRNAAQSIQNGLQLARAEAVKRNKSVRFSLVTSVGNDCALSTSDGNWVVSLSDPATKCATPPGSDPGDPAPQIIQIYSKTEGAARVVVDSDQSQAIFDSLGQLTSPAVNICVGITNVSVAACSVTGDERHLQVKVSAGGQIRICDPKLANGDPQGC